MGSRPGTGTAADLASKPARVELMGGQALAWGGAGTMRKALAPAPVPLPR